MNALAGVLVRRLLAKYLHVTKQDLDVSLLRGDIVVSDARIRREALQGLDLPFDVERGVVKRLRMRVPWAHLRTRRAELIIEDVRLLAVPPRDPHHRSQSEAEFLKVERERKQSQLDAFEEMRADKAAASGGWSGKVYEQVMANLHVSMNKVHVRFEDFESSPGSPYAIGIEWDRLEMTPTNPNWEPTFLSELGARTHRLAALVGFSIYVRTPPRVPRTADLADDLDWETYMSDPYAAAGGQAGRVVGPMSAELRYVALTYQGLADERRSGESLSESSAIADRLDVRIHRGQYEAILRLVQHWFSFCLAWQYATKRPQVPVLGGAAAWWRFAGRCIIEALRRARVDPECVRRGMRLMRDEYRRLWVAFVRGGRKPAALTKQQNSTLALYHAALPAAELIALRAEAYKIIEAAAAADPAPRPSQSRLSIALHAATPSRLRAHHDPAAAAAAAAERPEAADRGSPGRARAVPARRTQYELTVREWHVQLTDKAHGPPMADLSGTGLSYFLTDTAVESSMLVQVAEATCRDLFTTGTLWPTVFGPEGLDGAKDAWRTVSLVSCVYTFQKPESKLREGTALAEQSLVLQVNRPSRIVQNTAFLTHLAEWFRPPRGWALLQPGLSNELNAALQQSRQRRDGRRRSMNAPGVEDGAEDLCRELIDALHEKYTCEVCVDILSPTVLLPRSCTAAETEALVVNLGRLRVNSHFHIAEKRELARRAQRGQVAAPECCEWWDLALRGFGINLSPCRNGALRGAGFDVVVPSSASLQVGFSLLPNKGAVALTQVRGDVQPLHLRLSHDSLDAATQLGAELAAFTYDHVVMDAEAQQALPVSPTTAQTPASPDDPLFEAQLDSCVGVDLAVDLSKVTVEMALAPVGGMPVAPACIVELSDVAVTTLTHRIETALRMDLDAEGVKISSHAHGRDVQLVTAESKRGAHSAARVPLFSYNDGGSTGPQYFVALNEARFDLSQPDALRRAVSFFAPYTASVPVSPQDSVPGAPEAEPLPEDLVLHGPASLRRPAVALGGGFGRVLAPGQGRVELWGRPGGTAVVLLDADVGRKGDNLCFAVAKGGCVELRRCTVYSKHGLRGALIPGGGAVELGAGCTSICAAEAAGSATEKNVHAWKPWSWNVRLPRGTASLDNGCAVLWGDTQYVYAWNGVATVMNLDMKETRVRAPPARAGREGDQLLGAYGIGQVRYSCVNQLDDRGAFQGKSAVDCSSITATASAAEVASLCESIGNVCDAVWPPDAPMGVECHDRLVVRVASPLTLRLSPEPGSRSVIRVRVFPGAADPAEQVEAQQEGADPVSPGLPARRGSSSAGTGEHEPPIVMYLPTDALPHDALRWAATAQVEIAADVLGAGGSWVPLLVRCPLNCSLSQTPTGLPLSSGLWQTSTWSFTQGPSAFIVSPSTVGAFAAVYSNYLVDAGPVRSAVLAVRNLSGLAVALAAERPRGAAGSPAGKRDALTLPPGGKQHLAAPLESVLNVRLLPEQPQGGGRRRWEAEGLRCAVAPQGHAAARCFAVDEPPPPRLCVNSQADRADAAGCYAQLPGEQRSGAPVWASGPRRLWRSPTGHWMVSTDAQRLGETAALRSAKPHPPGHSPDEVKEWRYAGRPGWQPCEGTRVYAVSHAETVEGVAYRFRALAVFVYGEQAALAYPPKFGVEAYSVLSGAQTLDEAVALCCSQVGVPCENWIGADPPAVTTHRLNAFYMKYAPDRAHKIDALARHVVTQSKGPRTLDIVVLRMCEGFKVEPRGWLGPYPAAQWPETGAEGEVRAAVQAAAGGCGEGAGLLEVLQRSEAALQRPLAHRFAEVSRWALEAVPELVDDTLPEPALQASAGADHLRLCLTLTTSPAGEGEAVVHGPLVVHNASPDVLEVAVCPAGAPACAAADGIFPLAPGAAVPVPLPVLAAAAPLAAAVAYFRPVSAGAEADPAPAALGGSLNSAPRQSSEVGREGTAESVATEPAGVSTGESTGGWSQPVPLLNQKTPLPVPLVGGSYVEAVSGKAAAADALHIGSGAARGASDRIHTLTVRPVLAVRAELPFAVRADVHQPKDGWLSPCQSVQVGAGATEGFSRVSPKRDIWFSLRVTCPLTGAARCPGRLVHLTPGLDARVPLAAPQREPSRRSSLDGASEELPFQDSPQDDPEEGPLEEVLAVQLRVEPAPDGCCAALLATVSAPYLLVNALSGMTVRLIAGTSLLCAAFPSGVCVPYTPPSGAGRPGLRIGAGHSHADLAPPPERWDAPRIDAALHFAHGPALIATWEQPQAPGKPAVLRLAPTVVLHNRLGTPLRAQWGEGDLAEVPPGGMLCGQVVIPSPSALRVALPPQWVPCTLDPFPAPDALCSSMSLAASATSPGSPTPRSPGGLGSPTRGGGCIVRVAPRWVELSRRREQKAVGAWHVTLSPVRRTTAPLTIVNRSWTELAVTEPDGSEPFPVGPFRTEPYYPPAWPPPPGRHAVALLCLLRGGELAALCTGEAGWGAEADPGGALAAEGLELRVEQAGEDATVTVVSAADGDHEGEDAPRAPPVFTFSYAAANLALAVKSASAFAAAAEPGSAAGGSLVQAVQVHGVDSKVSVRGDGGLSEAHFGLEACSAESAPLAALLEAAEAGLGGRLGGCAAAAAAGLLQLFPDPIYWRGAGGEPLLLAKVRELPPLGRAWRSPEGIAALARSADVACSDPELAAAAAAALAALPSVLPTELEIAQVPNLGAVLYGGDVNGEALRRLCAAAAELGTPEYRLLDLVLQRALQDPALRRLAEGIALRAAARRLGVPHETLSSGNMHALAREVLVKSVRGRAVGLLPQPARLALRLLLAHPQAEALAAAAVARPEVAGAFAAADSAVEQAVQWAEGRADGAQHVAEALGGLRRTLAAGARGELTPVQLLGGLCTMASEPPADGEPLTPRSRACLSPLPDPEPADLLNALRASAGADLAAAAGAAASRAERAASWLQSAQQHPDGLATSASQRAAGARGALSERALAAAAAARARFEAARAAGQTAAQFDPDAAAAAGEQRVRGFAAALGDSLRAAGASAAADPRLQAATRALSNMVGLDPGQCASTAARAGHVLAEAADSAMQGLGGAAGGEGSSAAAQAAAAQLRAAVTGVSASLQSSDWETAHAAAAAAAAEFSALAAEAGASVSALQPGAEELAAAEARLQAASAAVRCHLPAAQAAATGAVEGAAAAAVEQMRSVLRRADGDGVHSAAAEAEVRRAATAAAGIMQSLAAAASFAADRAARPGAAGEAAAACRGAAEAAANAASETAAAAASTVSGGAAS